MAVDSKFSDYLFGDHDKGGPKGAYFRAIGFDENNWEDLRDQILDRLPYVEGRFKRTNKVGGQNWEAAMEVQGPAGKGTILTCWVVTPDAPTALIGAYPLGRKRRKWGILRETL